MKRQKHLPLLAAMLAISGAAMAQGTFVPIGLVSDKLCFSVGEVVVSEKAGFWAVDATLAAGIQEVFSHKDVEIRASGGGILIRTPQEKLGAALTYSLYSAGGKLLCRERISGETTLVCTDGANAGEPVIITVAEGGKTIATVKILRKK